MAFTFAHDVPEQGLSIARHLSTYFFARQMNREFLRWLQVGIEQTDPESDEGLFAIAFALVAAENSNNLKAVDQLAEKVANGIDLARSPAVRARLLTSHAAYLIDIEPRAADKLLADATELLQPIDKFAILSCIHNRLMIAWRTGDLPHAEAMAADLDDLPDRPIVRRQRVTLESQAAACTGKWEEAIDLSLKHYGLDEETSLDLLHFRAEALGALGRLEEAIATLDQVDALGPWEGLSRSNSQILRATTERSLAEKRVEGSVAPIVETCVVCQRLRSSGSRNQDRDIFICAQCEADADQLFEIQDTIWPVAGVAGESTNEATTPRQH